MNKNLKTILLLRIHNIFNLNTYECTKLKYKVLHTFFFTGIKTIVKYIVTVFFNAVEVKYFFEILYIHE